jgi:hypothetical protein
VKAGLRDSLSSLLPHFPLVLVCSSRRVYVQSGLVQALVDLLQLKTPTSSSSNRLSASGNGAVSGGSGQDSDGRDAPTSSATSKGRPSAASLKIQTSAADALLAIATHHSEVYQVGEGRRVCRREGSGAERLSCREQGQWCRARAVWRG